MKTGMTSQFIFGEIIVLNMMYSNGNTLFSLKSERQLYLIFAFLAIAASLIFFFSINSFFLPYEFEVVQKIKRSSEDEFYFFRDYQNINTEFKFRIAKHPFDKFYKIEMYDPSGKITDQHNFKGKVKLTYISFHDINNDGIEELVAFSTKMDSLFLTVLELNTREAILNEYAILSGDYGRRKEWDINYLTCKSEDLNGDGYKDLIFGVRGGHSLYPRGVFTFDIKNVSMINSLKFNAGFYDLFLHDLDNDGEDEIIAFTSAVGNAVDKDGDKILTNYTDFYSWLFVLNKDLSFKHEPIKFTSYSSGITVFPLKNKLIVASKGSGEKPYGLYLFDHNLKETKYAAINKLHYAGKVQNNSKTFIYTKTYDNTVSIFDSELNFIKRIGKIDLRNNFYSTIRTNNKNITIFLADRDDNRIVAIDDSFNIIASQHFEDTIFSSFLLDYLDNYLANSNNIKFHSNKYFYTLDLVENSFYSFLNIIFLTFAILLFTIFIFSHRLSKMVSRRFRAYGLFINSSNKAILIIDQDGQIKSYNDYFIEFVNNAALFKKNRNYGHYLTDNIELKKFLDTSIKSKREHRRELIVTINNERKNISASVYPLISFWGFAYAYIIELDDITNPIMDERQKIWAQTSQKIAHDIKTPLSTIQLNIKALNQRVDKENLKNKDDFKDDLSMISSEVGRIRELTKSFLQFASLERPILESINIKDIIEESLLQFKTYFASGVKLETSFQEENENILADSLQLKQLFHILIENAIDSMNGKGIIELKTVSRLKSKLQALIDIEISDNGCGISEEKVNKIFDPYFTTKKDGNGMGLTIAKKIVEDNNGEIKIYSKEGLGTTITVSFTFVNE